MMRVGFGFGLAVLMTLSGMQATTRAQDGADSHLGTYEFVSGASAEGEISKDRLKGTIKITRDEILLIDEEGKESFAFSYKVESEDEPYKVSMKIERAVFEDAVGATARGLGKAEGDTVTLIYDFGQGGEYPKNFEPSGQQHRFVMKKKPDAEG